MQDDGLLHRCVAFKGGKEILPLLVPFAGLEPAKLRTRLVALPLGGAGQSYPACSIQVYLHQYFMYQNTENAFAYCFLSSLLIIIIAIHSLANIEHDGGRNALGFT